MTVDVIERYETFNNKGCTYELLLGNLHDQPIPPNYYDLLNDVNDYDNNIIGTPVEISLWTMKEWKMHLCQMMKTLAMR